MSCSLSLSFSAARQAFINDIFSIARSAGGEARLVGGVVRNGLLARDKGCGFEPEQDLDVAVNLPVTVFAEAARQQGLRVLETGFAHGTVTVMANEQQAEVTQLRSDVDTDGRHATIRPTTNWQTDALRRDFTINALYLDAEGSVYDFVGGLKDLEQGYLRFVGEAARRLQEDHLRLLRALRFLACYPNLSMPERDQLALSQHVDLLPILSAERIAGELKQLMTGAAALPILRQASIIGVDRVLFGTIFSADILVHPVLQKLWGDLSFVQRLACCLPVGERAKAGRILKLSRAELRFLLSADQPADKFLVAGLLGPHWARSAYHLGDVGFLHALQAACSYKDADWNKTCTGKVIDQLSEQLRRIFFFQPPRCPVSGRDVIQHFRLSGPVVGACLDQLRQLWAETEFTATKTQLLTHANLKDFIDQNKSSDKDR
tara:strand:- start:2103 stop:3401 length:1299 start_codon:yes stop_codon:yes gene_type:complete